MSDKHSKREYLARFRGAVYTVSALLVATVIAAVPAALGRLNLSWAAPVVGFLLLLALLMLNLRSDSAAKAFKRLRLYLLIPSLKEVIDYQKDLNQCRTIVKRMGYTLSFYNLWALLSLEGGGEAEQNSEEGFFNRLKARLRWDTFAKWAESDPEAQTLRLPDDIAYALMDVAVEEDRIEQCAEKVAEHFEIHLAGVKTTSGQPEGGQLPDTAVKEPGHAYDLLISEARAELQGLTKPVWRPLLELLYREHHELRKDTLWSKVKQGERAKPLVAVLLWSGKLPRPEDDLPYSWDSLTELVAALESFSLDEAREKVLSDQQRRRENRQVCEGMEYVLDYYGLYKHLQEVGASKSVSEGHALAPALRRELIDEPPRLPDEASRIQECAERLAAKIQQSSPSISPEHLELLYLERHASPQEATQVWHRKAQDEGFVLELAGILVESCKLPKKEDDIAYEKGEVQELLDPDKDFTLDDVRTVLLDDGRRRYENRVIVRRMDHTLRFYNLDSLSEDFQNSLTSSLAGVSIKERQGDCAQQVSSHLKAKGTEISASVLHLLYLERHEPPKEARTLWNGKQGDPGFTTSLADVLLTSKRLPDIDKDLPLDAKSLGGLLRDLNDFSLDRASSVVVADQEWRRANRAVIDRMLAALEHFCLSELLVDNQHLRRTLIDTRCGSFRSEERLEHYASEMADSLRIEMLADWVSNKVKQEELPREDKQVEADLRIIKRPVMSAVLKLLYLEHSRQTDDKERCWRDEKQDEKREGAFTLLLAALLVYSSLLPHRQDYVPYGIGHLQDVLSLLPSFSLSQIIAELKKLNEVWQRCQRYRDFLEKNDIDGLQPQVKDVLQYVEISNGPSRLDREQEMLTRMGEKAICATFPKLEDFVVDGKNKALRLVTLDQGSDEYKDLVHALSLISLIIFITEELTESLARRTKVCRLAAQTIKSKYIAFGYLQLRERLRRTDELDGREFLTIDCLVRSWAKEAEAGRDRLGQGFREEIETISEFLGEGAWLRRLPYLLDRTYRNILEKNSQLLRELEEALKQRPSIREPLETVFKSLSVDTIARYLQSRKRVAYLLTFRVRGGALAYLVDCLVSSDGSKIKQLQDVGVKLQVNGQPKYSFKQYTNSARIGIVPAGWSFDSFFKAFQEDLTKVINARADLLAPKMLEDGLDELDDIEVVVSQFDLSGVSQHWFGYKELTKPRAKERVRELFAGVLSGDELAMLIEYEGYKKHAAQENLADAIMILPITELIASQLRLKTFEREALDREDEQLKKDTTGLHNCRDIRELGKVVGDDEGERERAIDTLTELLEDVLQFDTADRRQNIARVYITTLGSVARISN